MTTTSADAARPARPLSRGRKALFASIALTVGLVIAFGFAEVALRVLNRGGRPPAPTTPQVSHDPTTERDPARYWACREGSYVLPPLVPGGPEIHETVLAGGRRATEKSPRPGRPIVALLGCSYTHGVGLSDEETYAWKLQDAFPEVEIRNYGTPGYGTYQCLLTLEGLFQGPETDRPALVLHGYIWFHPWRNIASSQWLRSILKFREDGGREFGEVPFCTLEEGQLRRHEPDHFRMLPGGAQLETVGLLESAYNRLRCRGREKQYRTVTDALLIAMKELCEKNKAGFVDIVLTADEAAVERETAFGASHGIEVVNVSHFPMRPEWELVGDPHPNGVLNTLWAEEIGRALGDRFRSLAPR